MADDIRDLTTTEQAAEDRKAWEFGEKNRYKPAVTESDLGYRCFLYFLELSPKERSVINAYRKYVARESALMLGRPGGVDPERDLEGGSTLTWYRWAREFFWADRARSKDIFEDYEASRRVIEEITSKKLQIVEKLYSVFTDGVNLFKTKKDRTGLYAISTALERINELEKSCREVVGSATENTDKDALSITFNYPTAHISPPKPSDFIINHPHQINNEDNEEDN